MKILSQLRAHPFLFLLGSGLAFLILFALSTVIGLAFGVKPERIGQAMVGVLIVGVPAGGVAFVRQFGETQRLQLRTPEQRKIFLLSPIGVFLVGLSYFSDTLNWSYWVGDVLRGDYQLWAQIDRFGFTMFVFGFTLLFCGLVFSFFYDQTLGKLRKWING